MNIVLQDYRSYFHKAPKLKIMVPDGYYHPLGTHLHFKDKNDYNPSSYRVPVDCEYYIIIKNKKNVTTYARHFIDQKNMIDISRRKSGSISGISIIQPTFGLHFKYDNQGAFFNATISTNDEDIIPKFIYSKYMNFYHQNIDITDMTIEFFQSLGYDTSSNIWWMDIKDIDRSMFKFELLKL